MRMRSSWPILVWVNSRSGRPGGRGIVPHSPRWLARRDSVTPTGLPVLWSGDQNYQKFRDPDGTYFYNLVGVTSNSTVTMTLAGVPVKTFGFEAEPDSFGLDAMSATFYNGVTTLGSISLNVSGNGGALLFAATSNTAFTKVVLTDTTSSGPAACAQPNCDDFAIANVRFSSNPIPEPASLLLLGTGIGALGLRKLPLTRWGFRAMLHTRNFYGEALAIRTANDLVLTDVALATGQVRIGKNDANRWHPDTLKVIG